MTNWRRNVFFGKFLFISYIYKINQMTKYLIYIYKFCYSAECFILVQKIQHFMQKKFASDKSQLNWNPFKNVWSRELGTIFYDSSEEMIDNNKWLATHCKEKWRRMKNYSFFAHLFFGNHGDNFTLIRKHTISMLKNSKSTLS